ncbi:MAG: ribosome recycling factor [Myxococcota bacterium]
MTEDVLNDFSARADQSLEALRRELSRMRTGRANLSMLDGIRVDYYGQSTQLNGVAALQIADPRLIVIKPWDKSMMQPIERAIQESGLGINPMSDGEVIRLPIPPLTEERRKEMSKQVRAKGEEYKVAIRNARRDARDMLEELEKEKEIGEDDRKRALEKLQALTDERIKKVDEVIGTKEEELMTI